MTGSKPSIAVRGAGIVGLWQALTLARAGHPVTLYEQSSTPFTGACSPYAGAMLAPRCEEESAEPVIRELGLRSIALWRKTYPGTVNNGSLVVALPRDRALLDRFARMTKGFTRVGAEELAALEPDLATRFASGLYYPDEAHVAPAAALAYLLDQALGAGVNLRLAEAAMPKDADIVVDCRGLGAREDLPTLRGVRGERIVVRSREVALDPAGAAPAPALSALRRPLGRGPLYDRRHPHRERGGGTHHLALGARAAECRLCARPRFRRGGNSGLWRRGPPRLSG